MKTRQARHQPESTDSQKKYTQKRKKSRKARDGKRERKKKRGAGSWELGAGVCWCVFFSLATRSSTLYFIYFPFSITLAMCFAACCTFFLRAVTWAAVAVASQSQCASTHTHTHTHTHTDKQKLKERPFVLWGGYFFKKFIWRLYTCARCAPPHRKKSQ